VEGLEDVVEDPAEGELGATGAQELDERAEVELPWAVVVGREAGGGRPQAACDHRRLVGGLGVRAPAGRPAARAPERDERIFRGDEAVVLGCGTEVVLRLEVEAR
jgi:hypothetical protein